MWLIDTTSLALKYVSNDDVQVRYAILSHRWEEDEATFGEMKNGQMRNCKGVAKVRMACHEALKSGFRYIWIDTCCIDKASSAELSEAINSMYHWYSRAEVCYVYLSDVDGVDNMSNSAWFTRGWTLQELVAPRTVKFFNRHWQSFGTKHGLQTRLLNITGIPTRILRGDPPDTCSIAQRMSWASARQTSRPEDRAYSLMDLFDVNMPMLYGEGKKAFIRLQEEIIRISDDHSIFAWQHEDPGASAILAPSPACFARCAEVIGTPLDSDPRPYSVTNAGLSIRLPLVPWAMNTYLGVLQCQAKDAQKDLMPYAQGRIDAEKSRIGIFVRKTHRAMQFERVTHAGESTVRIQPALYSTCTRVCDILITQRPSPTRLNNNFYGLLLRQLSSALFGRSRAAGGSYQISSKLPLVNMRWSSGHGVVQISQSGPQTDHVEVHTLQLADGHHGTVGIFHLLPEPTEPPSSSKDQAPALLRLGFAFDFNPVCVFYRVTSTLWSIYRALHGQDLSRLTSENLESIAKSCTADFSTASLVSLLTKKKSKRPSSSTTSDILQYIDDFHPIELDVSSYGDLDHLDSWNRFGVCVTRGQSKTHADIQVDLPHLNVHVSVTEMWMSPLSSAWLVDFLPLALPGAIPSRTNLFDRVEQNTSI